MTRMGNLQSAEKGVDKAAGVAKVCYLAVTAVCSGLNTAVVAGWRAAACWRIIPPAGGTLGGASCARSRYAPGSQPSTTRWSLFKPSSLETSRPSHFRAACAWPGTFHCGSWRHCLWHTACSLAQPMPSQGPSSSQGAVAQIKTPRSPPGNEITHSRACAQAGIAVTEYTPNQIKQSVTGNGRADKDQVRAMVTRLTRAVADTDHAADALAAAICHASAGPLQAAIGVRRGR